MPTQSAPEKHLKWWQLIERKQKIIGQIMTSKVPTRNLEDVDDRALSYAEVKAVCTGDPRLKEQMELDIAVSKLKAARNSFQNQKYRLEDKVKVQFPREIQQKKEQIENLTSDLQHLAASTIPNADDFSPMVIDGTTYSEKKPATEALQRAIQTTVKPNGTKTEIGSYRGFTMSAHFESLQKEMILTLSHACTYRIDLGDSPTGNLIRIDNLLHGLDERVHNSIHQLEVLQEQQHTAEIEVQKPFAKEAEYREKTARLAKLNAQLQFQEKDKVIGGKADSKEQCEEKQMQEGVAQKEAACL